MKRFSVRANTALVAVFFLFPALVRCSSSTREMATLPPGYETIRFAEGNQAETVRLDARCDPVGRLEKVGNQEQARLEALSLGATVVQIIYSRERQGRLLEMHVRYWECPGSGRQTEIQPPPSVPPQSREADVAPATSAQDGPPGTAATPVAPQEAQMGMACEDACRRSAVPGSRDGHAALDACLASCSPLAGKSGRIRELRKDFWYWGIALGYAMTFPVGDVALPGGRTQFKPAFGAYFELPFDISKYIQLVPHFRIMGGAVNTGVYEEALQLNHLSGLLFDLGTGARFFPFEAGDFRPLLAVGYQYTWMGVERREKTGSGSCTYFVSPPGGTICTEDEAVTDRAYHAGHSLLVGLGGRYDIRIKGKTETANLVSFYLEVDYILNWWRSFSGNVDPDHLGPNSNPERHGMVLDHIQSTLGIGFHF